MTKLNAKTYPIKDNKNIEISNIIPNRKTPGNVAVCFSGGGSRAMIASVGQMRALKEIVDPKSRENILSQTKLLSSVSGGSWTSLVFSYLKKDVVDDEFLNKVVSDPSQLTLKAESIRQDRATVLSTLPDKCYMKRLEALEPAKLLLRLILLMKVANVALPDLWNTLIGSVFSKTIRFIQRIIR